MAEQVNHKCTVANLPVDDAVSRKLNEVLERECPIVLESSSCIRDAAQKYDLAINPVVENAAGILVHLQNQDDGGGPISAMKDWATAASTGRPAQGRTTEPLYGSAFTGDTMTQEQMDNITKKAETFRKNTRPARKAQGPDFNTKVSNFKNTNLYKDKQNQFDILFDTIKKAYSEADNILHGPALGKSDDSCVEKLAKSLAAVDKANKEDQAVNIVHNVSGKGAKANAKQYEDATAATAAGAISIKVTYDLQYKEQCILLSQIAALSRYSQALDNVEIQRDEADEDGEVTIRRRLPYIPKGTGNAPLVVDGESFGFINKLTQPRGMGDFYNLTNAQISSLQPLIRLYRVENANKKGGTVREKEIFFDSNLLDSKSVLMDKTKRGFGVGIEKLDVVFEGQDMFAQKRCIKANLTLFAHDFGELLKPRGGFKYLDLALKTGKNIKQETKNYKSNDDLNFRLKAVFGWAMPTENGPAGNLQNVLKNTFVSVNLTPVTHTFDFDEFGRVKFNIEYLAYIEEHCAKNNYNIFTDPETYSTILRRKLAFDSANRTLDCEASEELKQQVKDIKNSDIETIKLEKATMHAFLMKELFLQGYVHFLNFNFEDLESVIRLGPSHDLVSNKVRRGDQDMNAKLSDELQAAFTSELNKVKADKDTKKEMASAMLVAGGDAKQIAFFYVGDLLNIIVGGMDQFLVKSRELVQALANYRGLAISPEILESETLALQRAAEEFKKFRLVLGPLEIVDHKDESVRYVNFADVPISVKYFSEWLTSKLLKKDQALYTLTQFLKDLFNDLLKNYLNDDSCFPFSIKQKVRLFEGVVTSYPDGKRDEITSAIINNNLPYNRLWTPTAAMPVLNIRGRSIYDNPNPGIQNEMNYFIFYAGRTQPIDQMNGIKSEDEPKGIYHYLLGRDRGLVKNISLNKTDSPGLKEVRFEQEGYDGLHQLREMYDVEVDSYANLTAFPGNYIFVDPLGFAPNLTPKSKDVFDLTDLGVGGYYMVTRASHELGPGFANTKLNAVWVASQGGAQSGAIVETGRGSNEMKAAKCSSKQAKQGLSDRSAGDIGDFEYMGARTSPYTGLEDNPDAQGSPGERAAAAAANAYVLGGGGALGIGAAAAAAAYEYFLGGDD